jgi:tetratricopeptide (TPR) repeat protein
MDADRGPRAAYDFLRSRCSDQEDSSCAALRFNLALRLGGEALSEATKAFLDVECRSSEHCAGAEATVGAALAARGQWQAACVHYARAAELLATAEAWLELAQAAEQAGNKVEALQAVRRAEKAISAENSSLKQRLEDQKSRLYRDSVQPQ